MSIPAGHIITVGGLNVIDRLQDSGLQNPRIPTETIRETGNDLVVGKILTEANFSFQMTSWDVSCDMMAMLTGKVGAMGGNEGPAHADPNGTKYDWRNCQFINLACPWAQDPTGEHTHITSGVVVPMYYPTALSYKFGVTANAEQTVTLNGGTYYMADEAENAESKAAMGAYPIEETATGNGATATFETGQVCRVYRIGGAGGTTYKAILGVLVNGVIQQPGVDYKEEGTKEPGKAPAKVKIKFTVPPAEGAVIKWIYFAAVKKEINEAAHASTTVTPAAVRGRNIEILVGEGEGKVKLHGIQSFDLNATHSGEVQREMGEFDPIGYNETGIDCNGTIQIEPKEKEALYQALETLTGVSRKEVFGYLNENPQPLEAKIYNPKEPTVVLKSIRVKDALLQIPGTFAKVLQVLSLPLSWESQTGTFEEVKGE
jgi:hypothetical protein